MDRWVWANSADPDQTAAREAVLSGSTLFAIESAVKCDLQQCKVEKGKQVDQLVVLIALHAKRYINNLKLVYTVCIKP